MNHYNSELSLVVEVKSKDHVHPVLTELKELGHSKLNKLFSPGDNVLSTKEGYVYQMLTT